LARLYDASSPLVYGLALRILGDAGAAEEVTLDVYLQVWKQANRFDPLRGRVSTWLMTNGAKSSH
jgi:RNA polymerase sigma-70 factor (ECF subfamily)